MSVDHHTVDDPGNAMPPRRGLLHARAGDLAAEETGETPLVAGDIARVGLPRLFRRWAR